MSASPCLLSAAADSTSPLISFKPYLSSPTPIKDDKELVKPRSTSPKNNNEGERISKSKTKDETRSFLPNSFGISGYKYHPHSIEKITQEEKNSIAPSHDERYPPPPLHNQIIPGPPTLETRFEVMQRMKAMASETTFPYARRRFESMPDYSSLYRNGISTSRFDELRRHGYDDSDIPSRARCAKGCPCDENKETFHNTPNLHAKTHSLPHHFKADSFWLNNRYARLDEKHPYYQRNQSPAAPLSNDYVNRNSQLEEQHRIKRNSDNPNEEHRSSAFSRFHMAQNRGLSDPGYLSDPTSQFYSKYHFQNPHSDPASGNISYRPYQQSESQQRRYDIDEQMRHRPEGNKLQIYDQASKAALKAFDAHVEKMMTDRKGIPSNPHEFELRRDELQATLNLEKRPTTSTSVQQPLVQVSTVDSTQTSETTHSVGGLLGLAMVANEHLGQAIAKEKRRTKNNNCLHLWQFLRSMLDQEKDKTNKCIEWTNRDRGEFRLIKTAVIADLWGQSKNRTCMTYEKMARAMRYYYKMKILEKVPHKRLHFRFGEKILAKVLDSNSLHSHAEKFEKTVRDSLPKPQVFFQENQLRPTNINSIISNNNNIEDVLSPRLHSTEEILNPHLHSTNNLSTQQKQHGVLTPNTGVIRSTEEFNNGTLTVSDNIPFNVNKGPRSTDSDPSPGSYSGEDTPSEISDFEGELVVDADVE